MKTTKRLTRGLLGAAVLATLATAAPATASAAEPTDEQIRAALVDMAQGTYDQADIDLIMNQTRYPDLAETTPDPRPEALTIENKEVKYLTTGPQPAPGSDEAVNEDTSDEVTLPADPDDAARSSMGIQSTAWKWVEVTYTRKSLLGFTLYKYHHKVNFQYNGSRVTAWGSRSDWFTNEDDVFVRGARIENWKTGVPASSARSHMKRHVQLCAAGSIGCYANLYPWVTTKVKGNGTYTYTGAAG
ncbi:hypothetical protein [Streptomyces cadmiisoli]|uniref:hypothetical protein n=1 Tax=Streptomyces cadmiisoli TaxID=2184053 RepID=UPI00365EC59F